MKIWFDVSGLYTWQGNFTGIQRVTYSLASELQRHDANAGFFIYQHGAFHEVSFEALNTRLTAGRQSGARPVVAHSFLINRVALQHGVIVTLKDTIRGSRLDLPLRRVYGRTRAAYRRLRQSRQNMNGRSPFQPGDCVVVIDGNWQFPGYPEALETAKKHSHFMLVHFVHDLIAVRNPALANTGADRIIGGYFQKICRFADLLLTNSDATTEDLRWFLECYNIRPPQMAKLTLGDNVIDGQTASVKPSAMLDKQFILAVSTIEIRKNYRVLYDTYKLAHQGGISLPQLVIVGRKGWMAQETYTLLTKDPDVTSHIVVLERVTDAELEWLYQHCMFTVFPSFYEGWGLPVVESLAHSKACISSNVSSMPEAGGKLAHYVSPYSSEQFMEAIAELADGRGVRRKLEQDIAKLYHRRTWADVYADLVQTLGDFGQTAG